MAIDVKETVHRVHRLLNMGNYMLAGYETPYVHIQGALNVTILEASRLYLDIRHGRISNGLVGLTEMQLLWSFATAIRHCYGYDFFKKALPLSMLRSTRICPKMMRRDRMHFSLLRAPLQILGIQAASLIC